MTAVPISLKFSGNVFWFFILANILLISLNDQDCEVNPSWFTFIIKSPQYLASISSNLFFCPSLYKELFKDEQIDSISSFDCSGYLIFLSFVLILSGSSFLPKVPTSFWHIIKKKFGSMDV